MARVVSNPLALHRIRPYFQAGQPPPPLAVTCFHYQIKSRRFPTIVACQIEPNLTETSTTVPSSSILICKTLNLSASMQEKLVVEQPVSVIDSKSEDSNSSPVSGLPEFPNKDLNKQIAVVSILAAVGLFLSTRLDFGVSLKDLSAAAIPYEEALSNGKPTVVEFYADWCEVCRELAPDVYKVEQQFKYRVNFVMLNVDNTKWEQELDEFGVEGIPHFAFLDKEGNEEGNVVGRFPRKFLLENVDALARGEASVPHARVVGQYSSAESRKVHQVVDPRSHG